MRDVGLKARQGDVAVVVVVVAVVESVVKVLVSTFDILFN